MWTDISWAARYAPISIGLSAKLPDVPPLSLPQAGNRPSLAVTDHVRLVAGLFGMLLIVALLY